MKKITIFFFILLYFTVGTFAQDFEANGIRYRIIDNVQFKVEVISKTSPYVGTVVIPANTDYHSQLYSVISIGNEAFMNCVGLTSITIPTSITTIGNKAFRGCTGLTSIVIPNSVSAISEEMFRGCTSLTSMAIPIGVTSIGMGAFRNCASLRAITIPNSVTAMGMESFYGCSGLTSVTIPDGVTIIDNETFYGCSSLISVTIPESVTTIGTEAFRNCTSLGSVVIPNRVTTINEGAFRSCSGLAMVTIPSSVVTIGLNVFHSCTALRSIEVDIANTQYASIDGVLYTKDNTTLIQFPSRQIGAFTIPNTVTTIAESAFMNCSHLTSVTIPNTVTNIGDVAFAFCSGLTAITIPNSVTSIGSYAFYDCIGLTSVTIGSSVADIGKEAFSECPAIKTITSLNPLPPGLDLNIFFDVDKTQCILFVPENSVTLYAAAEQWREFINITPISASSVSVTTVGAANLYTQAGTLYVTGATRPYIVYSLTGAQIYTGTAPSINLPHGTYVVSIGNERRKVVVQ